MSGALNYVYEFLTRPSSMPEIYKYLPQHGAMLPILLINTAYALFVFRIGPWLMRDRKPFNLKRVLVVYNIIQIIFNLIIVALGLCFLVIYAKQPGGLACVEKLSYDHPQKSFEILCGFVYLTNKFLDLSETIFMVLRKSFKQVTFLHVYHHMMMTSLVFLKLYYEGSGGHIFSVALLNGMVHTVMYVYYLMSSMSENIKKSLWWKKYITQLQLLQFILDLIHASWPLLFAQNCRLKRTWLYMSVAQAIFMIYLFGSFYIRTYVRKQPAHKKLEEKKL